MFAFPTLFPATNLRAWFFCFFYFGFQKRSSFGENGHPSGDGDLWLGRDVILHGDVTRGNAGVRGHWCGKKFL